MLLPKEQYAESPHCAQQVRVAAGAKIALLNPEGTGAEAGVSVSGCVSIPKKPLQSHKR
jgi:hypothetical protein